MINPIKFPGTPGMILFVSWLLNYWDAEKFASRFNKNKQS